MKFGINVVIVFTNIRKIFIFIKICEVRVEKIATLGLYKNFSFFYS